MASTVGPDEAGNEEYQNDHMSLIFSEGFSFSGFERDQLSLSLGDGTFQDVSGVSGIDSISDGRSAVVADFDNDGDLDVFRTSIQGQGHSLFRNNVGQRNKFVRISLEGTSSGKDAFGAIVRVKTSRGLQTQVKSGGSGFLAQHDPRLLFGLGNDARAESVEIVWPSGKSQRLGPVAAGASVKVVESGDSPQMITERLIRLPEPLSSEQTFWRKLRINKSQVLPRLTLRSLPANEPVSLKEGNSYFLNFWATWCGPCRKEMPELQRLLPRFEARGIQIAGLSLDQDAEPAQIAAFARNLGVSYPIYLIEEESIGQIFGDEVFVPLSLLVDETGHVVELFAGWDAESERRILRLLE